MPLDNTSQIELTTNGGTFQVWDEVLEENYSTRGSDSYAKRRIRCAWGDRVSILVGMLGGGVSVGGSVVWVLPTVYPTVSGLVAYECRVTGDGVPDNTQTPGLIAYPRAQMDFTYRPPQYDPASPNFIGSQDLDFSGHAVALDSLSSGFKWSGGPLNGKPLPPSGLPVLRFTTATFTQSRFQVPTLPVPTVIALAGNTVNQNPFFGAPAEHVSFLGARSSRKITPGGATNWDVTFHFEYHPFGWNKLPQPGATPLWQPFTTQGGDKLWTPADFSALFT